MSWLHLNVATTTRKLPIDVFVVDSMLWNDLEIGIDHYH
jgi:hypothetical protein